VREARWWLRFVRNVVNPPLQPCFESTLSSSDEKQENRNLRTASQCSILTGSSGGFGVGGLEQRVVHGRGGGQDVRVDVREAERAAHHQHVPLSHRVARHKVRKQPRRLLCRAYAS